MNKTLLIIGLSVALGVMGYALFAVHTRDSAALDRLRAINSELSDDLRNAESRAERLGEGIARLEATNDRLAKQAESIRAEVGGAAGDAGDAIGRIDRIIERTRRIASLFEEYERAVRGEIDRLRADGPETGAGPEEE